MDKSREHFEAWAEEVGALPWGHLKKQRTPSGGYSVQIYNYMWSAWQASRAAIEVELPKRQEPTSSGHYGEGYLVPNTSGTALDYDDTVDALRAAGITVKGEDQ